MNIKEDVKKVMGELQKSVDANGEIDLFFMLQEVINLFERVKNVLPTTNAQERQEQIEKHFISIESDVEDNKILTIDLVRADRT